MEPPGESLMLCILSASDIWDGMLPYLRQVTLKHPETPHGGQSQSCTATGLLARPETTSLQLVNVRTVLTRWNQLTTMQPSFFGSCRTSSTRYHDGLQVQLVTTKYYIWLHQAVGANQFLI